MHEDGNSTVITDPELVKVLDQFCFLGEQEKLEALRQFRKAVVAVQANALHEFVQERTKHLGTQYLVKGLCAHQGWPLDGNDLDLDSLGRWVLRKKKADVKPDGVEILLPVIYFDKPLPQPKFFEPAVLAALAIMTGGQANVWVDSDTAITLALDLLGVTEENCPWQWEGRQSIRRLVGYAYRNAKDGYRKRDPFFCKTNTPGKWALNKTGAKEALQYLQSPKLAEIAKTHPPPQPPTKPPSEANLTSKWLSAQGPEFVEELRTFAQKRFPKSYKLGKTDDHVQVFLLEPISKDKIGEYFRRHGKEPNRNSVLSWWQRNHITSQLRKEGVEPVCISLHGTRTEAARERVTDDRLSTRSHEKAAEPCLDTISFLGETFKPRDLDWEQINPDFQAPSWEDSAVFRLDLSKKPTDLADLILKEVPPSETLAFLQKTLKTLATKRWDSQYGPLKRELQQRLLALIRDLPPPTRILKVPVYKT